MTAKSLSTLSTDTTSQLDIFGHDRHTLCMNGAQISILKESHQVGFCSFLQGQHGGGLETKVGLEILCHLTNKTLKGRLADQEVGRLLILADLTKRNCSRAVSVGFLDTAGSWGGLSGSLI